MKKGSRPQKMRPKNPRNPKKKRSRPCAGPSAIPDEFQSDCIAVHGDRGLGEVTYFWRGARPNDFQ